MGKCKFLRCSAAKGKDPMKPHVKLGKPLMFLLSGANFGVIQQGMLRNNPGHVKDSVSEATEVLSGMLNTHKWLLESGVEIQKRLESHPASKKMGIFRRLRSASLGDPPKKLPRERRGLLLLPPKIGFPRKGRAAFRQHTLRPPEAKPQKRMGNGSLWRRKQIKK